MMYFYSVVSVKYAGGVFRSNEEHENKLKNAEAQKKHKISAKKLWHTLDYDRDVYKSARKPLEKIVIASRHECVYIQVFLVLLTPLSTCFYPYQYSLVS